MIRPDNTISLELVSDLKHIKDDGMKSSSNMLIIHEEISSIKRFLTCHLLCLLKVAKKKKKKNNPEDVTLNPKIEFSYQNGHLLSLF